MSNKMSDLDVCRSLLSIIDEMYEADGITPKINEDPREASHSTDVEPKKVDEAMMDAYGVSDCGAGEPEQQVDGSVTFRQEKNTDKGSVSIEANADDMQELAKVLQMAGLTLPKEMSGSSEASADDEDPEQEELLLPKNDDEANGDDAEKQNAKQTLVNIIKDKLQKRLK